MLFYLFLLFRNKRYLRPDHLLGLYWNVNIIAGLLMFNVNNDWNYYPLIYILMCCIIFSLGFQFGDKIKLKNIKAKEMTESGQQYQTEYIKTIIILGIIAGFIYSADLLRINGFSVRIALSDFRLVGNYFNNTRYFGEGEKTSTIGQICLTIYYSIFALGGLFHKRVPKMRKLIIIAFIPGIFNMLCTTSKTVVIGPVFLWLSGWLVEKSLIGEDKVFTDRGIKRLQGSIKYIVLVILAFYAIFQSFVIRYGGTTYTNIYQRISVYALGHIPCFETIFKRCNFTYTGEGFGYYTFRWVCDLIGIKSPVPSGTYNFGLNTAYGFTNVPTIFTDFIMDYGYFGALFECVVLGIIVGVLYRNVNENSQVIISLLGLSYYCILYSFLVNPMRYLTIVGAFVLLSVYLYVGKQLKVRSLN